MPIDISNDFKSFENTYYLTDSLINFDPRTASGEIVYKRYEFSTRQAFDNMLATLDSVSANEFPATEYDASPTLPFSIQFVSSRTVRIRATSGFQVKLDEDTLMFAEKIPVDKSWVYTKIPGGHLYRSEYGSVMIMELLSHISN